MKAKMNAQPAGASQEVARPAEAEVQPIESGWEGVLDCGAAGPGREAPALFYQPAGDRRERAPAERA